MSWIQISSGYLKLPEIYSIFVKYWDSNSIGNIKEGLESTPMGSFNVGQRDR